MRTPNSFFEWVNSLPKEKRLQLFSQYMAIQVEQKLLRRDDG